MAPVRLQRTYLAIEAVGRIFLTIFLIPWTRPRYTTYRARGLLWPGIYAGLLPARLVTNNFHPSEINSTPGVTIHLQKHSYACRVECIAPTPKCCFNPAPLPLNVLCCYASRRHESLGGQGHLCFIKFVSQCRGGQDKNIYEPCLAHWQICQAVLCSTAITIGMPQSVYPGLAAPLMPPVSKCKCRCAQAVKERHPEAPPRVQWVSGVLLPPGVELTNGTWSPRVNW
eukprot:scaffold121482_cov39-Tisochrysis_lutea.AAC.2